MPMQIRIIEVDPALEVIPCGDESATVKQRHAQSSVCLDEMARLLALLFCRFLKMRALRQFQQLRAQIMGFYEVRADEIAHPEPPHSREDFLSVIELLAEFEGPDIVFFYLLHRVTLGGDQSHSQLKAYR